jgi:hypothetical protein
MTDIFIVGPARSGTSWLQTMLAEHPDIASPPETGLFVDFIGKMDEAWRGHLAQLELARAHGDRQNLQGLATVLTDDDMLGWLRSLYSLAHERVVAAKPGATRLLEKTPDHAGTLDVIWRIDPNARVIFLVRDPRDTVRSLLEASGEPWGHWAPDSVEGATNRWLRGVRRPLRKAGDPRLLTVRYEDLRAGDTALCRVAEFLDLGAPSTWLKTATDVSPSERDSTVVTGEAAATGLTTYALTAFSYHDRTRTRSLTPFDIAYIESRCGPEMEQLGYETGSVTRPIAFRARVSFRALTLRLRHGLGRMTLRSRKKRKMRAASPS